VIKFCFISQHSTGNHVDLGVVGKKRSCARIRSHTDTRARSPSPDKHFNLIRELESLYDKNFNSRMDLNCALLHS
jgi:hypothetical protein